MTMLFVVGGMAAAVAVSSVIAALEPGVRERRVAGSLASRPSHAPGWARRRLDAADVSDVDGLWRLVVRGSVVVVLGCVLTSGVAAAVMVAVSGVVAALLAVTVAADRRSRRIDRELPPTLESVARALRSGASVHAALERCGTNGTGVGHDLAALTAAPTLSAGLETWTCEQPIRSIELTAAALAVGTMTGTGLAGALDRFSVGLRVRSDTRAEARALSTQARASAGLLAIAPFAFLAVMAVTDARIVQFLFGSPAGWLCLLGALVLDAGAAAVMIAMTRIDR